MIKTPRYIEIQNLPPDTKVEERYLDIDKKEFVSKETLLERYPNTPDHLLRTDFYYKNEAVHQVLFAMSSSYFTADDAAKLSREIHNLT